MKTEKTTNTRSRYESPAVFTVPLSMRSVICVSNGTTQDVNIEDPYAEPDLG